MKAYTYWECTYCKSITRGDNRTCYNCGAPIPNNAKYIMPNDPRVIKALHKEKISTHNDTHVDESGVVSEIVESDKERSNPNWKCTYCGYQNFAELTECAGCGAPRSNISYFDDDTKELDNSSTSEKESAWIKSEPECIKHNKFSIFAKLKQAISLIPSKYVFGSLGAIAILSLLAWLFIPVSNVATVTKFEWTQTIEVEEFTLCHEDGWQVPDGGRVTHTSKEIYHYDSVLDHYETKSRQVSELVLDGYSTSYRDLGNGQCDIVETPRYRTEWHTEFYDDPVYVQVPVYKTKYYYDIDRWIYNSTLTTHEFTHDPYWYESDIPDNISNPNYGDLRLGFRDGEYKVHVVNDDGELYSIIYDLNTWSNLMTGDELRYKSFRFSNQPISDTEVIHKS